MASFQLADVVSSSRGSKTCRLRTLEGEDVVYITAGANGLVAPFGPGTFDATGATRRKNFVVRLDDEETHNFFKDLDAWAVDYITDNSERIFGHVLTKDQVKTQYLECSRQKSSNHLPMLHTKFWTNGRGAIRCWDASGVARELPTRWRYTRLHLRLHVSHLWIMGKDFGFVIECTDLRVLSEEPESAEMVCPWQELSPLGPFTDVDDKDGERYNECWPNERGRGSRD